MTNQAEFIARIRREVEALAVEFRGMYGIETIQRCADESVDRFASARVREFVPLLLYKFTRERLMALGQLEGRIPKDRPEILFVCVHNAGRSQMAAILMAHHSGGRVNVRSAGTTPAGEVNPVVVDVMREMGLDLSQEFPKPLADEFVRAADVVVTMGCGDACPLYPGKRYLDWAVSDPADQSIGDVRAIRDDISRRVQALLAEILEPA